jgi:transposase
MHIACTKNHGINYLQVHQAYSVMENGKRKTKKRLVKNLGPLSRFDDGKGDYLKRLRLSFKQGKPLIKEITSLATSEQKLLQKKQAEKIILKFDKTKESDCSLTCANIGYFLLEAFYTRLGIRDLLSLTKTKLKIKYDLNDLTKLLVFARSLTPACKRQTFLSHPDYLFFRSDDKLHDCYRCLSVLDRLGDKVQKRMNTKIRQIVGERNEVVFYDVTNFFFTIGQNDRDTVDGETQTVTSFGLRKKGVSKEKRVDPIVQMGLFIDQYGLPIAYKLFPGNQTDQTTLRPALEKSINSLNFGKVIIVADGGLNSGPNLVHILNAGNGYVVSKSTAKSDKLVKAWILDQGGYHFNSSGSFKSKSIIRERIILDQNKNPLKIKEKLICFWSEKHYRRELKENQQFIKYLHRVIAHPDKLKDKQPKIAKFLKKEVILKDTQQVVKTQTRYCVDQTKVQQYLDLLGYYTIMTSEVDKPDSEVISIYHGLSKIEDSFRLLKTDLNSRPVYVSTPEHINAHFLICFIALTIIRLIQYQILTYLKKPTSATQGWQQGLSAQRIKKALLSFQVSCLPQGYFQASALTDNLKLIFASFGLTPKLNLPTISELHQLKYAIGKSITRLHSHIAS